MTGPQIIVLATPVFLALMALEFIVGVRRGRNTYRLHDAAASVGLGMLSQVMGVFTRLFTIGVYAAVYEHWAVFRLPADSLAVWAMQGSRDGQFGLRVIEDFALQSDDWAMYPLLQPGSLVVIDETRRKVTDSGWANEFERPIYFFEHRKGYACCWCNLTENHLVLQPHPASLCSPEIYAYPEEIDVIGQITGVAMRLDAGRRRRVRG